VSRLVLCVVPLCWLSACAGGVGLETLNQGADTDGLENLQGDDDDDDDDGGGSGGDGGDSGPSEPTPQSPTITDLTLSESNATIDVDLTLSDPDDDLVGGQVVIATNSGTQTFTIPTDLSGWSNNVASVRLDRESCDAGTTVSVSAYVSDTLGNDSAAASDSLHLSGSSATASEIGDLWGDNQNVGGLTPPMQICGDIYLAANDGVDAYAGDIDWIQFQAGTSGQHVFSLTWDSTVSDYDLALYESTGVGIAGSVTDGTTQPESFSANLTQGNSYVLRVGGWSGEAVDYVVDIP